MKLLIKASALINEQSVTAAHMSCASRPFALQYIDLRGDLAILRIFQTFI